MKGLSEVAGISRQSHYRQIGRIERLEVEQSMILQLVHEVRRDHPKMGCRKIYKLLNPSFGRDRFEALLSYNGLNISKLRNYQKTTRAGITYFADLIEGKELTGINQVWQSDITYIRIGERFYYLVFIVDVFSRRILGYQANEHLLSIANTRALEQAISLWEF